MSGKVKACISFYKRITSEEFPMFFLRKLILILAVILSSFGAQAKVGEPIRVLILSGRSSHDWRDTNSVIERMLVSTGRFKVDISNRPSALNEKLLAPYQLIISNWTSYRGHTELEQWPQEAKDALLNFVRNGGGHMVIHVSGSNFYKWPEYQKMIGGASWKEGISRFVAPGTPLKTRPTSLGQSHPITQGVASLTIIDELYTRMDLMPATQTLIEAYADKHFKGDGRWYPVAAVNTYGEGRNFILLLGHSSKCMENPLFETLLQRGAEWAATDCVSIPIQSFDSYILPKEDPKSYLGHSASNPVHASFKGNVSYDEHVFTEAVQALREYQKYNSREALLNLESLVSVAAINTGDSDRAADILIKALADGETTADARAHYMNFLSLLANDSHLKVLEAFQGDRDVIFQLCALYERLGGTKAKGAIARAISQAENTELLLPYVLSAGRMNADAAIGPLKRQLKKNKNDLSVVRAILNALSQIRHIDAYEALLKVAEDFELQTVMKQSSKDLQAFMDGILLEASIQMKDPAAAGAVIATLQKLNTKGKALHIRKAAFREILRRLPDPEAEAAAGLKSEDPIIRDGAIAYILGKPDNMSMAYLLDALPKLNMEEQLRIVSALKKTGRRDAIPVFESLLKTPDKVLRNQVILAMGVLGNAATAEFLLDFAEDNLDEEDLPNLGRALESIGDPNLQEILKKRFPSASPLSAKIIAAQFVQKRDTSSQALLLVRLKSGDPSLERVVLNALGEIGTTESIAPLLDYLKDPASEKAQVKSALIRIVRNNREEAGGRFISLYMEQPLSVQSILFDVLAAIGTLEAYAPCLNALKGTNTALAIASIRALSNWPDAVPAEDLLRYVQNSKDAREKVLALRSLAAVIDRDQTLGESEKSKLRKRALSFASREEEKQLFIKN